MRIYAIYYNNDLSKKNHNLAKATSPENVVYSFTYDTAGNPLTSKVEGAAIFMESSATYTDIGNYISTLTDSEGNKVKYNYNETKGTLSSVKDAKGKTTSYTYDGMDRLEKVSKVADGKTIENKYSYENDRLKSISHNGFTYNFEYDSLGNNLNVKVGTQSLMKNTFEARTSKLLESEYGNGQKVSNGYDNLDRIISKKYNGVDRYRYQYDASGNIGYHEDLENNVNYRYVYDLADRLVRVEDSVGNTYSLEYDKNNNGTKITDTIQGKAYTTSFEYDKDNRPKVTTYTRDSGTSTRDYTYDSIGRLTSSKLTMGTYSFTTSYAYKAGTGGATTTKVNEINNNGKKISYTYDSKGNIETITEDGKTIKYYYNELNELIREDNGVLGKTIAYVYDEGGNIRSKTEYTYNNGGSLNTGSILKTYSYEYTDSNWKDKLTSFDGKAITYDAIGNPLSYNGYTYTWKQGRQLATISGNGLSASYLYNDSGIRTQKTVNGVTTKYHLVGDKVTYEDNGTDKIYYTYDDSDNLVSMNLNGVEYYYIKNAQNDIIGLIDKAGTQVVSYLYDSWGKLVSIDGTLKDTVGVKNSYRCNGYRYDEEIGLYYLKSRYYNPDWGRFINADGIIGVKGELLSHNMFAYCANDPVNSLDPSGYLHLKERNDGGGGGGGGFRLPKIKLPKIKLPKISFRLPSKGGGNNKTVPNPNGKNGGLPHQTTIENIKPTSTNGRMQTEYKYNTPNGTKSYRYADKVEMVDGEVTKIYQAGRVNKNGLPVTREAKAIEDIMNSPDYNRAPIYFMPYNSDIGPIIYMK